MYILAVFLSLIIVFQVKHWYIDFVLQTDEMVKGKGIYGNPQGLLHSFQHGIVTFGLMLFYVPELALMLACIDFVTHYHIDYIKMKYGCRDITQKEFWIHLGLDQMMHQIVYVLLLVLIILG
jgi:hypothetical protein